MSTKEKTTTVSYRKKRDYTKQFVWTYELNRDVYQCYIKAKRDPSIGYTKRLKEYWEHLHPEFNYFTVGQLRQQATFVERKGLCMQTNLGDITVEIEPNITQDNVSIISNEDILSTEPINEENIQNNINGEDENLTVENVSNEEPIALNLLHEVKSKFLHYYVKYEKTTLAERNYDTHINYNIKNDDWKAINTVVEDFIKEKSEGMSLWILNVIQYAAIVTILDRNNLLKERKHYVKRSRIPTWQRILEDKINNIRRKISYILVIKECRNNSTQLSKRQLTIKSKLKRWYGNTKPDTLSSKLAQLRHDLGLASKQLHYRKKLAQRESINKIFRINQKQIFRDWRGKKITSEETPTKEEITSFWAGIWSEPKLYNHDAPWVKSLEKDYCKNTNTKNYELSSEVLQKVLGKMKNNSAPGNDLIRCYWIKKLTATHGTLVTEFRDIYEKGELLPEWLVTGRTILLPKNEQTRNAKNYRPIACQNITYKLFTGILNSFMVDHCVTNDIITLEQAGGKPGSWGCTDQLLINKMILDEVKQHRRNLYMMWFDYKKAFDSVPHDWILKALRLARVPHKVINTIENLMKMWSTKLYLKDIETDAIKYLTGFLQGDCLSLIMFILCVNPLSFLLKKLPGYKVGKPGERNIKINHLFFVDDLKTYSHDLMGAKAQLDLITTFTKDIGMEFGNDKCAYIHIKDGKQVSLGEKLTLNGTQLNELDNGDQYKYLGQDESIGYDDVLNKERVTKEYFRRMRKIWSSELFSNNKAAAHNIFAIPVVTPTFGLLNWTKEELEDMDVKTRKILTSTGSFHINSDIDRLYTPRNKGGRGLNSLVDIFISRIVSIHQHLKLEAPRNTFLASVIKHEKESLNRVAEELLKCFNVNVNETDNPKLTSMQMKTKMKEHHFKMWNDKIQHGYLFRTRSTVDHISEDLTNAWMKKSSFSSHVEGYVCAIQEEEIFTNDMKARRMKQDQFSPICRMCKKNKESIQHVIASCPQLSVSMYLPWRHNKVANIVYQNIIAKDNESKRRPIQEVYSDCDIEVWWDTKINTLTPCKHNRPDIILWRKADKKCYVIDICVCLDVNIDKNIKMKNDHYLPLTAELKRLYGNYSFEVVPIVIGATGLVTKSLATALDKIGLKGVSEVILGCQKSALLGTMKIVKSVMKM